MKREEAIEVLKNTLVGSPLQLEAIKFAISSLQNEERLEEALWKIHLDYSEDNAVDILLHRHLNPKSASDVAKEVLIEVGKITKEGQDARG